MDLEQLTGRYRRLKDELAVAYGEQPWPAGRIERLAQEIAATEQAIATWNPSTPARVASRTGGLASPVVRNRLTPFGRPAADPAGD